MIRTIIETNNLETDKAKAKGNTAYVKINNTRIGREVQLIPYTGTIPLTELKEHEKIILHPYEILTRIVRDWRGRGITYLPKDYVGEDILILPYE